MTSGQTETSTTDLPGVLGMVPGVEVTTFGAPRAVISRLLVECPGVIIDAKPLSGVYASRPSSFIGGFCFLKSELTRALPAFRRLMSPGAGAASGAAGAAVLWVFWPREEAWDAERIRPEMGVTAEAVTACAASLGLSAAGHCELDAVWSGLKLAAPDQ